MFFMEVPDGCLDLLSPLARDCRSAALREDWDSARMCWNVLVQNLAQKKHGLPTTTVSVE